MPSDRAASQNFVKPGHWLTASQSLRSNIVDTRGELRTELTVRPSAFAEKTAQDTSAQRAFAGARPVVLPKGQMRRFDVRLLAQIPSQSRGDLVRLSSRYTPSHSTAGIDTAEQRCRVLAPEEFLVVVLTQAPERFARLQTSDWVRPFHDPLAVTQPSQHYRIVFPSDEGLLPLPATMLDWTYVAAVVWDDISADSLTPSQLQAVEDWIHFGGRLIVNGPDGADSLRSSSLASRLPIGVTGNTELDLDAATNMMEAWSVAGDDSTARQIDLLRGLSTRVAAGGDLHRDANPVVGTGDLLATRELGRGAICQSRFDLASGWLANWKSFDSFFNAAILVRPSREFVNSDTKVSDIGATESDDGYPVVISRFRDSGLAESQLPALNSSFRLLSRDAVLAVEEQSTEDSAATEQKPSEADDSFVDLEAAVDASSNVVDAPSPLDLTRVDPVSGVSGWSESSDVMVQVSRLLRSESGIAIPESTLVIRSLGMYLFVLVVLNYVVFRLLGRLEYAWLAAPVIALIGAALVAREAQLDIGFARSQTELSLLELPANYSRGHLTRGIAIYNSLSTQYEVQFNHTDAIAAPVKTSDERWKSDPLVFETAAGEGPRLLGMNVGSNQVRMLHTEEIIDVGGTVRRESDYLVNETDFDLVDLIVVERSTTGQRSLATVATCAAGGRTALRFRDDHELRVSEMPMQTQDLIQRLIDKGSMEPGASRIVARIDDKIAGMTILPQASQYRGQTILVAHLGYGRNRYQSITRPTPDVNLVESLLKDRPSDLEPAEAMMKDEP